MKITIPSDLRSLYLASKRWNHAATVALYRKIVLDTSLPLDQLEKFEQCMHRGALKHLKDARDLTLYDASAIGEQKIRGQPRARGSSQAISKTQEAVLRVLKLFPNNRMTTFRYARFGVINAIALIPEICNLVHFQYCTTRSTFMDTERLHTLQDFLQRNKGLVHVHLSLLRLRSYFICPAPRQKTAEDPVDLSYSLLWPLRHQLKSLVCHDPWAEDPPNFDCVSIPYRPWFGAICQNFPQLRELGLEAPQNIQESGEAGATWADSMTELMKPLAQLRELRMLQLYQIPVWDDGYPVWHDGHTTLDMESFATSLFCWAQTHCPRLEVVAWSPYERYDDISPPVKREIVEQYDDLALQVFFVRRNTGQPMALRTTHARIMDEFPELSIPKFDPNSNELLQILIS